MATRKRTPKGKAAPAKKAEPVKAERNAPTKAIDFVPVWQESDTADEVAEHFGRGEGEGLWASSFASRLRKMGINLKKMKRRSGGTRKGLDVDALNALADEHYTEDEEEE